MKDWITERSNAIDWTNVAIAVGIVVISLLFRKIVARYTLRALESRSPRAGGIRMWAQAFEKPLRTFILVLGLYLALLCLLPAYGTSVLAVDRLFRSIIVLLVSWGIFNLSASSSALLESLSRKVGLDESSMLIPFVSKALRFVIVLIAITAVSSEWGFSIGGLIAGLGLGSLAIALAAKDTLSNIIGGMVIILEKPFAKGDWILTPSTEGVVEDITFRSTKIRTFADSVVIVPNATLADHPITNWSRMGKRRVSFTLHVGLDSYREKLAAAVGRIESELTANAEVDPETILVKFNEFSDQGLGLFIYYFTKTTDWSRYLTIRQEMNLMMLRILKEEGVRLAYPIQRIRMETGDSALPESAN